jgi:hypothetical protein
MTFCSSVGAHHHVARPYHPPAAMLGVYIHASDPVTSPAWTSSHRYNAQFQTPLEFPHAPPLPRSLDRQCAQVECVFPEWKYKLRKKGETTPQNWLRRDFPSNHEKPAVNFHRSVWYGHCSRLRFVFRVSLRCSGAQGTSAVLLFLLHTHSLSLSLRPLPGLWLAFQFHSTVMMMITTVYTYLAFPGSHPHRPSLTLAWDCDRGAEGGRGRKKKALLISTPTSSSPD